MNREEQLVFCKKCVNRKFDPELGLICGLTNAPADFEDSCEKFENDELIPEDALVDEDGSFEFHIPEESRLEIRRYQDLTYAIVGGLMITLLCALIWAGITVGMEMQSGYMAVALGFLVGMGVRFLGAGVDPIYGYVGAILAFLGCALGNLLSQIGFIANSESLSYVETLSLLDFEIIKNIYIESFHPMDVLFYGIAVYEGFRFAFRKITLEQIRTGDLAPALNRLRLPLVLVSFVALVSLSFKLSKSVDVDGIKTFSYESGQTQAEGEMTDGKEQGEWKFYYESGSTQAEASYKDGVEDGPWKMYAEDGKLVKSGTYKNGLENGTWLGYYDTGNLYDSSSYSNGRIQGGQVLYYDNGLVQEKGSYVRDRKHGKWRHFHPNGQLYQEGVYEHGLPTGLWTSYNEAGGKVEELDFLGNPDNDFKIVSAWGLNSEPVVANGNGMYKSYHANGQIFETGKVVDGVKTGIWKQYFNDGKLAMEWTKKGVVDHIRNRWSPNGEQQIVNGNGTYMAFYDSAVTILENGSVVDGLKEGRWILYFNQGGIWQDKTYLHGELTGESTSYYEDGTKQAEGEMKNNREVGEWTWYYESGNPQCKVTYKNGLKMGTQVFWNELGDVVKEEEYKNGVFSFERIY